MLSGGGICSSTNASVKDLPYPMRLRATQICKRGES